MIKPMTLTRAAQAFGGTLLNPDCQFDAVSTDTRGLGNGQLFVALSGEHYDAHNFLKEAGQHACGLVVEQADKSLDVPQWVVPDTVEALGQLAALNRDNFDGPLIAVTGSNGKTTVKNMLAVILGNVGPVLATQGNFNNQIGVPLTLLEMDASHQFAVVEMGAGATGDIEYLCSMVRPDISLVTNVFPAHVAGFGSVDAIAAAKGEIYRCLPLQGTAVVNLDDKYADSWLQQIDCERLLTFGVFHAEANFTVRDICADELGCCGFELLAPQGSIAVQLKLSGRHNVINALAAAACASAAGGDLETIALGLGEVEAAEGRMALRQGQRGCRIIDDSYNANPGSVRAAINTLVQFSGANALVLGDMAELGVDEESLHAEVGRYAKDRGVQKLYTFGQLSVRASEAFGGKAEHFSSRGDLIASLREVLAEDLTLLIKGSRSAGMEHVVSALLDGGDQ